ncbi:unnamed protein product, partial [Ectocarpus sp. 4 AP-2014]
MRQVNKMVTLVRTSIATGDFVNTLGDVLGDFIKKTIRDLQGSVILHMYSDVVCRRLFDTILKQVHLFSWMASATASGLGCWTRWTRPTCRGGWPRTCVPSASAWSSSASSHSPRILPVSSKPQ